MPMRVGKKDNMIADCELHVSEISVTLTSKFSVNGPSRPRVYKIGGKVVGGVVTATAPIGAGEYDLADIAIALRAMGFEAVIFKPAPGDDVVGAQVKKAVAPTSCGSILPEGI